MNRRQLTALCLGIALAFGAFSSVLAHESEYVEVWGIQREDNSYDFYASNSHFVPMYVSVSFDQLVNLAPDQDLPWQGAIPPGTAELPLFRLMPTTNRGRIGYGLVYSFAMGDPTTVDHDDTYLYTFPFAHGSKHRLTQGHNGDFSHFNENQYAVDFDLEEGTPIYAARDGQVVRVKEDGRAGGPSVAYADSGNVVMVAHNDGTFSNYVHLRFGGAEVAVGDRVSVGDLIGFSGNTGVSTGPHLHFDVRVPLETGRMQSIPVLFRGVNGEPVDPVEGSFYYASHPGGEPFDVVLGSELRVSDFAGHQASVPGAQGIEFRTEEYDLTYAIFVINGLEDAIDAEISFQLANMRADDRFPMDLRVPAKTEVFVTLLRGDPEATRFRYAPSLRYRRVAE